MMLKDQENVRHESQIEREKLEKVLSDLVEKNLMESSKNYNLAYRSNHYVQKLEQAESKTKLLEDKLKFMTTNL